MRVEYLLHMGDDMFVSNVARVSFNKWKDVFDNSDEKLINFLAEHNHWSPFAHPHITVRVTAPIFLARQLGKSVVGFAWNEISRRYVDYEPEFYWPEKWRKRAPNKKQGSLDEEIDVSDLDLKWKIEEVLIKYERLLDKGVAPEQARIILPQNMYTSWIWTGSLAAFGRVYNLRSEKTAQKEVQDIAEMLKEIIEPKFPISWVALTK